MLSLTIMLAMLLPCADKKPLDPYSRACAEAYRTGQHVTLYVEFEPPTPALYMQTFRVQSIGKMHKGQTWEIWYEKGELVGIDRTPPAMPDALADVNRQRMARGLHPYILDHTLQSAAEKCAQFKAARCLPGHTSNDFSFLPNIGLARATGAEWTPVMPNQPFAACTVFDREYHYAGAATAIGRNGHKYCSIFVR